jgi:hypothetical protein
LNRILNNKNDFKKYNIITQNCYIFLSLNHVTKQIK